MRRHARIIAGVGLALVWGCEPREVKEELREGAGALQRTLRADPTRGGKVGTLRALEVTHAAHQVARAVRERPDPACAYPDAVGFARRVTIDARRAGALPLRWAETIRARVWAPTRWSALSEATFKQESGQVGHQRVRWVVNGERALISSVPDTFWPRAMRPEDHAPRRARYNDPLQAALDSAPGWQPDGRGGWRLGEAPLRCGASLAEGVAWATRLGVRARVVSGALVVRRGEGGRIASRRLVMRWTIEGGDALTLTVEDAPDALPPMIEVVPEAQIMDIRPDHARARTDALRDDWLSRGWIMPSGR